MPAQVIGDMDRPEAPKEVRHLNIMWDAGTEKDIHGKIGKIQIKFGV